MNMLKNSLLIALFAMMVIIPLASAQNNTTDVNAINHLNIRLENKNVTNVIVYDEISKANLSSFNIQKPEELRIPSNIDKFDVVTFDHTSFNNQLKSGQGFTISFGGKDYKTELYPMKYENTSDGIYSYYGSLISVNSSDIQITTSKNVLIGYISLENETFWIIPVEPRARTEISSSPLHIIYNSRDIMNVTFTIDSQSFTTIGGNFPAISQERFTNLQVTPPEQWIGVNILVVTDQQFYTTEPYWLATAHYIINNATMSLIRQDINVVLAATYDNNETRRNQFHYTSGDQIDLFMNVYPTTILDSYSTSYPPDIVLYLRGWDVTGDSTQGETWGYTNPPDRSRYAWVQMQPDEDDGPGGILGYTGSPKARSVVSTHEIGHMFDSGHETRPSNEPQYARATTWVDPFPHVTVMNSFYNEGLSTIEFSSYSSSYCNYPYPIICHGDSTHDNARRIRETRDIVAMYAHKDKIGVFRPANGNWSLNYNYSSDVVHKTFHFGTNGDIPVVGNYNGDSFSDAAVFRPANGDWFLDYDKNGVVDTSFRFGKNGDIPVVGDFNGDGKSDAAVFRPSTGYWYLNYNRNGNVDWSFKFGKNGDIPVVGDFNDDGISDAGVFRNSSHWWYIDTERDGDVDISFQFGTNGDIPVVGNWGGEETDGVGVFRPSIGWWYLAEVDGTQYDPFQFGKSGDIPIIGDWNGCGSSHTGVFRPSEGNWYLMSGEVGTISFHFGTNGDKPNVGIWKSENIV